MATQFQVCVPDADIHLLRSKLELARLPNELDNAGWKYGVPLADMRRLVDRWKNGFDWRKQESIINGMPQFLRNIEVAGHGSFRIHYVHQTSSVTAAIPLLFVHGWPGSFLEVQKILPLLTALSPHHPSFHVVALSLPGYAFSQAPTKRGFGLDQYAEVAHNLMLALGYNEYVTQGGDWGLLITRRMAMKFGPKHVKAWHTNMPMASRPPPFLTHPVLYLQHLLTRFTEEEKANLQRNNWFQTQGSAYMLQQATQPQTLGYSLEDSPVGLLAWLYDRLVRWTDNYPWKDDEVLTWISIYWFSRGGPTASLRIYYEVIQTGAHLVTEVPSVPLGLSHFPAELFKSPNLWARALGNVVFQKVHTMGGHFAAYERPEELVDDLRTMYGKDGGAFGVVPGKSGFESLRIATKL